MVNVESRWLLKATRVSVRLGEKWLLQDVSLCLGRGEILTIVGPNGGGKTTLLHALLGLTRLHSGRIERARDLRIGYVPQFLNPSSMLPLSVLRFAHLCSGGSGSRSLQHIEEHLEALGIAELRDRPLHHLSGGELQKAMIARATAKYPNCLIMDEPLSGVDEPGQQKISAWLENYAREHSCSILLVSHDLHFVMAASERVLCLDRSIRCEGTPHSLEDNPTFLSLFGKARYALYAHRHGLKKSGRSGRRKGTNP